MQLRVPPNVITGESYYFRIFSALSGREFPQTSYNRNRDKKGLTAIRSRAFSLLGEARAKSLKSMDCRKTSCKPPLLYDIRHFIESMGETCKIPAFYDLLSPLMHENLLESMNYTQTANIRGEGVHRWERCMGPPSLDVER